MKKRGWYEKYIGYCFNDNGRECILNDVCKYEDGTLCFFMKYADREYETDMDYKSFMRIRKQTDLPR